MATSKNKFSPQVAKVVDEVTRRILSTVQPQRVLLFGSGARGEYNKDSDLDILVIMSEDVHRRKLAQKIYRSLRGLGAPVDVIVVTEDDVKNYGDKPGLILRPAIKEGQVLYDAR